MLIDCWYGVHLADMPSKRIHLPPSLKTGLLQKFDTRVVVVASAGHTLTDHWRGVDLADMHFRDGRKYGKIVAYAQSKCANIMFAKQIAAR